MDLRAAAQSRRDRPSRCGRRPVWTSTQLGGPWWGLPARGVELGGKGVHDEVLRAAQSQKKHADLRPGPRRDPRQVGVTKMLTVAVMGAGAVGCYFGGMLARAGHDVVLIGRPEHVQAIQASGLRLQTLGFDEQVRVRASAEVSDVRGASLVLFCVKSMDTVSAAQSLRPYLGADALVLSLQNGIDNAERLRQLLPQAVRAAVVYVAAEMAGAGHVRHHGRGDLLVERNNVDSDSDRDRGGEGGWVDVFRAAGVPVEMSGDVRQALWVKLILNCAYNALSAIGQVSYGRLLAVDSVVELMHAVVRECVAVASAEGVSIPDDIEATVLALARGMPDQRSSTAQDLARGRRTEIDHLNGVIVRRGREHGIPTPVNQTLQGVVHLLEAQLDIVGDGS